MILLFVIIFPLLKLFLSALSYITGWIKDLNQFKRIIQILTTNCWLDVRKEIKE